MSQEEIPLQMCVFFGFHVNPQENKPGLRRYLHQKDFLRRLSVLWRKSHTWVFGTVVGRLRQVSELRVSFARDSVC